MEVYFDWELDDKAEQPQDPNRLWVYENLRDFLKGRYKPLEEQIDAGTTPDRPAFVVFIWHDSGDVELKMWDINSPLLEKVRDSLTQSDMDYIMEIIGRKIDNAEGGLLS